MKSSCKIRQHTPEITFEGNNKFIGQHFMITLASKQFPPPNFCLTSSLLLNPVGLPDPVDLYSHYQPSYGKASIRAKMRDVFNQKDRVSSSSRKAQSRINDSSNQKVTGNSVVCIPSHLQSASPASRQNQKMSASKQIPFPNTYQNDHTFFDRDICKEENDLMKMKLEGLQYVMVPSKSLPIRQHIKSKKTEASTMKKLQREVKQTEKTESVKTAQAELDANVQLFERIISKLHVEPESIREKSIQSMMQTIQTAKPHQQQRKSNLISTSQSLEISREAPKGASSSRKLQREAYKVNVINFMEPKVSLIERKKTTDIFSDFYLKNIHDQSTLKTSELQKLLQKKYTSTDKSIITSNSDSLPSNSRVKGKALLKKKSIEIEPQRKFEENDLKKYYHTDCEQFIRAKQDKDDNLQRNRKTQTGTSFKNLQQRKEIIKNYTFRVRKQQTPTQSTHQEDFNIAGWQMSPKHA